MGRIARYLIVLSLVLIAIMMAVELWRGRQVLTVVQFAPILAVASIPVAMPAVLSVTMAVGARALARRKAIVTRLDAVEELAGLDVLCVDKTGTLTENRIRIAGPVAFEGEPGDVVLAGALSCPRENLDAANQAVVDALEDRKVLDEYEQVHYTPFDYVNKRTEAELRGRNGETFRTAKGAPANVMELARPEGGLKERADRCIQELAGTGLRTLAVARDDGVIVTAVEEARRVFERMNGYAIYRVTETIRIMFFVVVTVLAFNFYPVTTILVILLALLNDLPIMTIAYDNTRLSDRPVKWDMRRVLTVASVLGVLGLVASFGLLVSSSCRCG